jgi:CAAX prenyl protease-like protein
MTRHAADAMMPPMPSPADTAATTLPPAAPRPAEPPPPPHPLDKVFYGWEYVLPMAVFLLFTFAGGNWKEFYPLSYVLKTLVVACLLVWVWPRIRGVRWTHLGLGVLVGVIGVVQWVGMEKLLMSQGWLSWTRMIGDIRGEAFRPTEFFRENPALMWAFIAIRWLGPTLVVPVMEELFWRNWLWRNVIAPNDFRLAQVGEYDRSAFWLIPLGFAMVHPQWLTAIVWALLIAWLLVKTRSIGACIVAHGVTNFLLGAYVLTAHYALGWDEWYFW